MVNWLIQDRVPHLVQEGLTLFVSTTHNEGLEDFVDAGRVDRPIGVFQELQNLSDWLGVLHDWLVVVVVLYDWLVA